MWGLAGVTYLYNSVCLCYVLQLKYGDRFVMKPPDCSTKIIESSVARITFICRGLRNVGVPLAPCLKKKHVASWKMRGAMAPGNFEP